MLVLYCIGHVTQRCPGQIHTNTHTHTLNGNKQIFHNSVLNAMQLNLLKVLKLGIPRLDIPFGTFAWKILYIFQE